ncbi:MAG: hypothetical protein ABI905_14995 [Betaproteobacteria bacterium]
MELQPENCTFSDSSYGTAAETAAPEKMIVPNAKQPGIRRTALFTDHTETLAHLAGGRISDQVICLFMFSFYLIVFISLTLVTTAHFVK